VPSEWQVNPGAGFEITVRLKIADGWHINSHRPRQEYLVPTAVEISEGPHVLPGTITYPNGEPITLGASAEPLSVYSGSVSFVVPLRLDLHAEPGPMTVELTVHFQACDDSSCLAPQRVTVAVPLEVRG
jgi:DsbC/DsbD-like thiol-disulfide interchange protein